MSDYFKLYPRFNYNGSPSINILRRADITDYSLQNSVLFYDYKIENGERADNISYDYYDDPNYDWLIYVSNRVTDPYNDYPLSDENLKSFIKKKYGSISNAYNTIVGYKTNWETYPSELSTAAYDSLPAICKSYWEAKIGFFGDISGYERKKETLYLSTNKFQQLTLTTNSNFSKDDVLIRTTGLTQAGKATVAYVDGDKVTINHISGSFSSNASYQITNLNMNITETVNSMIEITNNLTPEEEVYFSEITAYDYEQTKNELNKQLIIIDKSFASKIKNEFKKKLK